MHLTLGRATPEEQAGAGMGCSLPELPELPEAEPERELGASAGSPPLAALVPVGMVARRWSGRMGFPSRCGLTGAKLCNASATPAHCSRKCASAARDAGRAFMSKQEEKVNF